MTSKNSLDGVHKKVFDLFRKNGLDENVSNQIAHSFTQFVLGYVTAEGVAQTLVFNGFSTDQAITLVKTFIEAKKMATESRIRMSKTNNIDGPVMSLV
jgi:hypothetical protein